MFDLELLPDRPLFKFNRQLPLFNWYYPFDFDDDRLTNRLEPLLNRTHTAPRRRAVYIHIPFCETICSFCPFTRGKYQVDFEVQQYVTALAREMQIKSNFLGNCSVDAIFVGGGTPSVLNPGQIAFLGKALSANFELRNLKEFTFEVEVKSVNPDKLKAMKSIGVNRISFGAQTFAEKYRRMFSLDATVEQIQRVAGWANDIFPYTNVDMIYGMAGQSLGELFTDAAAALRLRTTTLDFYPLNNLAAQVRMHRTFQKAGLRHLTATMRIQYRMQLDDFLRAREYVPINGYSYSRASEPHGKVLVQHSPKFLYHDIVYGYSDDEVLGYGSGALSKLAGFNLCNFTDRRKYQTEILDKGDLAHEAFRIPECPEKGVVCFPYRGVLDKLRIAWRDLPPDTSVALRQAIEAGLMCDRGHSYELTETGWLFYVNLMYFLMPARGKRWITNSIEAQIREGRSCEETTLVPVDELPAR